MALSRRSFLKGAPILSAGAHAALAAPFGATVARAATAAPIVETGYGKLRGRSDNGIHVFRGIPYGADTSGKNRFMAPRPPAKWSGVRDALEWGHAAPQPLPSGNYD
jgi:para-nitrobenzyl esterase